VSVCFINRQLARTAPLERSLALLRLTRLLVLLFIALWVTIVAGWRFVLPTPALAASNSRLVSRMAPADPSPPDAFPSSGEEADHSLPPNAVEIGRVFGFPVTNSMVVSWLVALGLIDLSQFATRNMKAVPDGAQNFLEWLVGGLYAFIEGIIGPRLTKRTFWFFATIFIFILAANWFGLLPGVGSIGWGHQTAQGFKIDQPLLRGANADVNMTLAMALVFFALWIYWSLAEIGWKGFLKELFGPKGESTGFMKWMMIAVFFAAGCLEVISILFRPVSLTFRLYGNIFAGENMLEAMAKMVPGFGWLLPVPFYFLELLMGLVQAMVFMLLTAVFTFLMCQHEEPPGYAHI